MLSQSIFLMLVVVPTLCAVLPLRDQWQHGLRALRSGDAAQAAAIFDEFEHWYAAEPLLEDPTFRESYLRHRALACLAGGQLPRARDFLDTWLHDYPNPQPFRAFLRFQAAEVALALEDASAAIEHWQTFIAEHPNLPEVNLVRWRIAEHALANEDFPNAREQLERIQASPHLPEAGRALIDCALALLLFATHDDLGAVALLERLGSPANAHPVGELWRSVLAPKLIEQALRSGNAESALRANDWLNWNTNRTRDMAAIRTRFEGQQQAARAAGNLRQNTWNQHWAQQLRHLEHSNRSGTGEQEEVFHLYALRLETLLQSELANEATILSAALAQESADLPATLQTFALRTLVRGLQDLKQFEQADDVTQEFLRRFPDDPSLPDMLFLAARNAAHQGRLSLAIERCRQLLATYPEHPASNAWSLQRVAWLLKDHQFGAALDVLEFLLQTVPESWRPFVALQTGLCHKGLNAFDKAMDAFRDVESNRMAALDLREQALVQQLITAIDSGDSLAFASATARHRKDFANGRQADTVRHLNAIFHERGGDTTAAIAIYQQLTQSESHHFVLLAHASLSRCFQQTNDWQARKDNALQWLRFSKANDIAGAPEPFLDMAACHGARHRQPVDPTVLHQLMDDFLAGEPYIDGPAYLEFLGQCWPEGASASAAAVAFDDWLRDQALKARDEGRLTPYVNLELGIASRLHAVGRIDSADTATLRLLQHIDPEKLHERARFATAMIALKYDFPEASDKVRACLKLYPESSSRPPALLALAKHEQSLHRFDIALEWLRDLRTSWPDSREWAEACLAEAQLELRAGTPDQAVKVLDELFEESNLPPLIAASGLLLRTKAQLQLAHFPNAHNSRHRLLTLYPDFHDICAEARELNIPSHS